MMEVYFIGKKKDHLRGYITDREFLDKNIGEDPGWISMRYILIA